MPGLRSSIFIGASALATAIPLARCSNGARQSMAVPSIDAALDSPLVCPSGGKYDIDGLFTGYPSSVEPRSAPRVPPSFEWQSIPKLTGRFTNMYMDACATPTGNYFYFINDWFTNDKGPVIAKCYNRFDFFNAASRDALELRVYGDHRIMVLKNGIDISTAALAVGGAAFASSPNVAAPHSIFEFEMFLPSDNSTWFTPWVISASDPCGPAPPSDPSPPTGPPPNLGNPPPNVGTGCEDPNYLLDEPISAQVTFGAGGNTLAVAQAPDTPLFSGIDKFDAVSGDHVVARGRHFGAQPGTVTVDGTSAPVLIWTDTRIAFVVPPGVKPYAPTRISGAGDAWSVDGPRLSGKAGAGSGGPGGVN